MYKFSTIMKALSHTILAISLLMLCACQNPPKEGTADINNTTEVSVSELEILEDVSLFNTEREKIALSTEIKKHPITIIDFWASWCAPCMRAMPKMVELYNEFSPKGLGIIGVSYDKEFDKWQEAIKTNNMTWLQLSDLRGWDDVTVEKYDITSIPNTIILDKEGHILAKGLEIEGLRDFIAKFFEAEKQ